MDKEKLVKFLEKLDYGPAPESDAKVEAWLDAHERTFKHFINGVWQAPNNGTYSTIINPSNMATLARAAEGDAEDVNKAMSAAKHAFEKWSGLNGHARAKYLYAVARALAKNSRLFAVLESKNNGKPIRESRDIDIPLAIRHFYYCAGWAEIHQSEYPDMEPGGVIGQIIPWNFPLLMLAWKIAPAIAVGNTVVLKPAETTPLTALLFAEMLKNEVGLPDGVVNIVMGAGYTGEHIVNHQTPWKIAFTGSTEVGRLIRKATAGSDKRLTMELGGKSPFIVFDDADLDSAVEGVVDAIWLNQGEVCCAGSRLLVQESVYDEFLRRLKIRARKLNVGNPLDKTTDIGAINSKAQHQKIWWLIQTGIYEGATCWQPENYSPRGDGLFVPPTIFTDASPSSTIATEEIFGPVLACMSFRTPDEAVQLANNTRYGLAASIWSENVNKALYAANRIKAGTIWINSTNLFDAASGFGGYRESGYGREGGREGILDVLKECRPAGSWSHGPKRILPQVSSGITPKEKNSAIDRTFRFLIGGKLTRPDSGMSFGVYSPDNELLGLAGDANRKDARNAVQAARDAHQSWSEQTPHLRAQILYFLAENLSNEAKRFAEMISRQTGRDSNSAKSECDISVQKLFYYAALADKFEGTVQPVSAKMLVTATKEPIGVIGARATDDVDAPLLGVVLAIAPAIAMGNALVIIAGKYALTALDLIQLIQISDVPAGVVNILSAVKPDAIAKTLSEHEDVDAVWFFGSEKDAADIRAASTGNMKRVWTSADSLSLIDSKRFLRESTQIKNIWTPFGV